MKNIKCNIWDNFFSQMKSPHYDIPDDFTLMLLKDNINVMNISSSFDFNSYKVSLFQNPINKKLNKEKNKTLNYLDDDSINNSTFPFIENLTNNSGAPIMDIYVNFTKGKVYLDWESDCKYLNETGLMKFTSKFFLSSYELITLFEEDDLFYNYIFMNPFNNYEKQTTKFLKDYKKSNVENKISPYVSVPSCEAKSVARSTAEAWRPASSE